MALVERVLKLINIFTECQIQLTRIITANEAREENADYERELLTRILLVLGIVHQDIGQIALGMQPKTYITGDVSSEKISSELLEKDGKYSIGLADPSLDMFYGGPEKQEEKMQRFLDFIEELKHINLRVIVK